MFFYLPLQVNNTNLPSSKTENWPLVHTSVVYQSVQLTLWKLVFNPMRSPSSSSSFSTVPLGSWRTSDPSTFLQMNLCTGGSAGLQRWPLPRSIQHGHTGFVWLFVSSLFTYFFLSSYCFSKSAHSCFDILRSKQIRTFLKHLSFYLWLFPPFTDTSWRDS